MNHDDVKISLGIYVLGALDARETAMVEAHLDTCDECQAELAELSGLPPMLGRVSAADVEHAAAPPRAVLDRLLADSARRNRRLRITRTMLGLAATVAIVTWGGVALINSATPETASSTAAGAAPAATSAEQAPRLEYGEADSPTAARDAQSDAAGSGPAEINMAPSDDPPAAPTKSARASRAPEAAPSPPPAEESQSADAPVAKMATEPVTVAGSRGDVTLHLVLTEREGGTEVNATMTGVPVDTKVELFAVARRGERTSVASWEVKGGDTFGGSTSLPVADIARFELLSANQTRLITIPVG